MASVSVSNLILFIAAVTVAVGVSGTLVTNVSGIAESIDAHGANVADQIDTEVDIISDPGSDAIYDSGTDTVSVLVKNTGERSLSAAPKDIDVLLDGQYVSNADLTLTVLDGTEWRRGMVVELEIDRTLGTGEHRVVVIVDGDRETMEFYT